MKATGLRLLLAATATMAAPAVSAQTAATAPAPAYYVAEFEIKDPEGIRPYSAGVAATFEPFGGHFIVRVGKVVGLEGEPPGSRSVIIAFPSLERAEDWYSSDAYRAIRPFRQRSGVSRTYIIEASQTNREENGPLRNSRPIAHRQFTDIQDPVL